MLVTKLISGLASVAFLVAASGEVEAGFVDYGSFGNSIINGPFDGGGVTVTGSGPLRLFGTLGGGVSPGGLGIEGGDSVFLHPLIDGSESALFRFDAGPATSITLRQGSLEAPNVGAPAFTVEGFDAQGRSLGIVVELANTNGPLLDISALFGGVALSAFQISGIPADSRGLKGGVEVATITYTAAVPEPSSLGLLSLGLGTAGFVGHRRRRPRAGRNRRPVGWAPISGVLATWRFKSSPPVHSRVR